MFFPPGLPESGRLGEWELPIASAADPWEKLRQTLPQAPEDAAPRSAEEGADDPWVRLRAIYLPFTEQEETAAQDDRGARQKVSRALHAAYAPYAGLIREASARFDVPEEIIAAVILVESGGNPRARANGSTAAGLMQTISATFSDARKALARRGMDLGTSPFDPEASIMAGTWYLDRMYVRARADKPGAIGPKSRIDSWKYPLEYYYAGPGHGVKTNPVIIIYSGGKKVVVDKPAYSAKVLHWAGIMRRKDV